VSDKRRNHWYLLGLPAKAYAKVLRVRGVRTLLVAVASTTVVMVGIESGVLAPLLEHADSPAFVPIATAVLCVPLLGGVLLLNRRRANRARAAVASALHSPTPGPLVEFLRHAMADASEMPDCDAFAAQSIGLAYALYGHGDDAARALSTIDWSRRAPLIQAAGLSIEGIVELLCRRDATHALELFGRARQLAAVGRFVPGANQTNNYYATCAAVAETLAGATSAPARKLLEAGAVDAQFPQLQLLATFALAIDAERAGDVEGAARWRATIHEVGPHCAPLQAKASDYDRPVA
jgi:hypothetical protein